MPKFKRRQERGGTAAGLASLNEVPLLNEIIVESDTGKMKIGDGATAYNLLPYFAGSGGGGGGGSEPTDGNKGDISVTGTGTNWQINADAVGNAELANMATKTYKGRTSAGTGNPEDVSIATLKADLSLPADTQTEINTINTVIDDNDTNAVHKAGTETITGAKTFSVSPTVPTPTTGTQAANKSYVDSVGGGGGLSDGDKGDIIVSGTGATWTIDNDVVTYAKMQNVSAASKLLGRGSASFGDPQEITLGTGLSMSGTTLNATGGGGSPIESVVANISELDSLITTATANPSTTYKTKFSGNVTVAAAKTIPANIIIDPVNSMFVKSGTGAIAHEGIGLLDPESKNPVYSGFAVGDVTFTGATADLRPSVISTELWDTGDDLLLPRIQRADAAFAGVQVKIVCFPREITGALLADTAEITQYHDLFFMPGEYPNTWDTPTGDIPFLLHDDTSFRSAPGARIHESSVPGANNCLLIGAKMLNIPGAAGTCKNIFVEFNYFVGNTSQLWSGGPSTVHLGNVINGAIRYNTFEGTHGYNCLGAFGTAGNHAVDSEISFNVAIKAAGQMFNIINGVHCRIVGNIIDGQYSNGSGALIDLEPNVPGDLIDDCLVADNRIIVRDSYDGLDSLGGIAVQQASAVQVRRVTVRGNIICGSMPGDLLNNSPDFHTNRLFGGIGLYGVLDAVVENNIVRTVNQTAYSMWQCRKLLFKNNSCIGGSSVSGFSEALLVGNTADSVISHNVFRNALDSADSTLILETAYKFPAVSSGSNLTVTAVGNGRFSPFMRGLSVFFNGSTYTIATPSTLAALVDSATDVNTSTDKITQTAHGYSNGDLLQYECGTTPIGGLDNGFFVYVVNKTTNDFQVSLTEGGSAINLTSTGTGIQRFTPVSVHNYTNPAIAKMTASIGTVTVKTFVDANVSTGADTITITAHGYQTGAIGQLTSSGTLPTFATSPAVALDGAKHWYIIRVDADTIKLATTLANALGGTAVDITAAAGGGTHTFTPEVETRFSNNIYDDNDAAGGYILDSVGVSQIVSTARDRYITSVADADHTATASSGMIVYSSLTAGRTVTLPDATLCRGKEILVKDGAGAAGTHNITLSGVSSQKIDGADSYAVAADYGFLGVKSTGSGWAVVLDLGGAAGTTIALIAHTGKSDDGSTVTTVTTDAFDTTGANFLVAAVSFNGTGGAPSSQTITDSKSNTWTGLTTRVSTNGVRLYYCKNATVGTGHTVTFTSGDGGSSYCSIAVAAFNKVDTASPFDQENGATSGSASTLATGSITPSTGNQLVVAAVAHEKPSATVDSGFTETDDMAYVAGAAIGVMLAYKVQSSAAAVNPTFTIPTSGLIETAIASFKSV